MAYGKKKVVFDRKKSTPRSAPPEAHPEPSSPSHSWSSASSSLTYADAQTTARPGGTLAGSVSHSLPAAQPVNYSSSTLSDISEAELYDTAMSTDMESMSRSQAAARHTRQSPTRDFDSLSSTSSQSADSIGGVGVGSVPASLLGGASLFVPEKESWERPCPPRSRKPHPSDVGSLHSTSVPMAIGPLSSTSSYTAPRPYGSRRAAPPGANLPTVMESYSSINIKPSFLAVDRRPSAAAQAARQAREAKLSSTLGRHASTAAPAPRTSALRREYRPGPRFPPIQHDPPNPKEHGTIIQRGFPGVKPKEVPVLHVEKDTVKDWHDYRAYLGKLKERHEVDVGWEGKGKWWRGG
ncbi:hypothetical protein P171DRAFT_434706 [Karstenula rhodostoma CBS 690.94]|uniref:Uncharacterized protein n=1 Tax=Karstenula rhodostoma CBS 690.94 TaxID=1392251 RepID=A0A9P4PBX8_9PLEO|nr:hypothetical protein P171DRAFT_434706 [Karstenula rhodostoma CBS 690.94]